MPVNSSTSSPIFVPSVIPKNTEKGDPTSNPSAPSISDVEAHASGIASSSALATEVSLLSVVDKDVMWNICAFTHTLDNLLNILPSEMLVPFRPSSRPHEIDLRRVTILHQDPNARKLSRVGNARQVIGDIASGLRRWPKHEMENWVRPEAVSDTEDVYVPIRKAIDAAVTFVRAELPNDVGRQVAYDLAEELLSDDGVELRKAHAQSSKNALLDLIGHSESETNSGGITRAERVTTEEVRACMRRICKTPVGAERTGSDGAGPDEACAVSVKVRCRWAERTVSLTVPGMIVMVPGDATDGADNVKTAVLYCAGNALFELQQLSVIQNGQKSGFSPSPSTLMTEILAPYIQQMFPRLSESGDDLMSIDFEPCAGDIFEEIVTAGASVVRIRAGLAPCPDFASEKEAREKWRAWLGDRPDGFTSNHDGARVAGEPGAPGRDTPYEPMHWFSTEHIAAFQESAERERRELKEQISKRFESSNSQDIHPAVLASARQQPKLTFNDLIKERFHSPDQ